MNWIDKGEITVYDGDTPEEIILYSPLARQQKVIKRDYFEIVRCLEYAPSDLAPLVDFIPYDLRPHVLSPEDYTLLTVLPNNRCNFNCTYCYSAGCRNTEELDISKLKNCINFFIETKRNRPSRRALSISFMGGGEPMLSWETVKAAIEYSEVKAISEDLDVTFRIISNGSLLSDDQIGFIKVHKVGMSISFEILEDIQNLQRKNFDTVQKNLFKLLEHGIDTQLNITVTPYNVYRMTESYTEMRRLYPQVRHAMFEPVTAQEMFATPSEMDEFYNAYIHGFMNILGRGRAEGVEITSFPYLRTIFPLKRACPGELCITAEGHLTGCYCVSTPDHPLFTATHYGDVAKDSISFDMDNFHRLLACDVNYKEECKKCTARWNCGGGCYHLFNSYDRNYREVVCDFTRRFVHEIIKFRVRDAKKDN
jgi:radical SAM protein with 4Fe4S-binding SPASM domain